MAVHLGARFVTRFLTDLSEMSYRLYLDICCLNRPFDDLEQERIRLEAEAILSILQCCQNRQWSLVNSNALEFELEKTSNRDKAEQVASLLALAQTRIDSDEGIEARAEVLIGIGFKFYDALHIALAEAAKVDVMLTTEVVRQGSVGLTNIRKKKISLVLESYALPTLRLRSDPQTRKN